jgi:hypothetical protein
MKKIIFLLKNLILFIFITSFFSSVYASVGRVAAIRGKAYSTNNQNSRELFIKSEIYINDIIKTEKNSRLQIIFNDETITALGPESTMKVRDFKWDKNEQKFDAEAKEGLFHIMGGKIVNSAPKNFKIDTPVASIGIRGSMFAFRVGPKTASIVFLGGKGIDIKTDFGSTSLLKPGFGTKISAEKQKIEPPRQFSHKEIKELQLSFDPEKKSENTKDDPVFFDDDPPPVPQLKNMELTDITSDKTFSDTQSFINKNQSFVFNSGGYTGSGFDNVYLQNPNNFSYWGTTQAEFTNLLKITEISSTGQIISFNEYSNFSRPDKTALYIQPQLNPDFPQYNFNINTPFGAHSVKADIVTSPLHEFYLVHVPPSQIIASNPDYVYTSTSYFGAGAEPLNYPFNKVQKYYGHFTASAVTAFNSENYIESISGGAEIGVNFANKRFLGILNDNKFGDNFPSGLITFGTIASDNKTLNNIKVIGTKSADHDIYTYPEGFPELSSVSAFQTSGSFYGSVYQGIGITADATLKNASNNTQTGKSCISMGGFKNQTQNDFYNSGVNSLSGFLIGVAEKTGSPMTEKRFFMNSLSQDFSIAFNKTLGTISGSLSAYETLMVSDEHDISGLSFGGTTSDSVYIDDKTFAAIMDSQTEKITAVSSGNKSNINQNTGFLLSANIFEDQNEYLTWGYWEASYNDPDDNSSTYHIDSPGSFFIAGQKTPDILSVLNDLSQTNTVLSYNGITNTAVVNDLNELSFLPNGEFSMELSLDDNSFIIGIMPNIQNPSLILNYSGNVTDPNGFYGVIDNPTASSGTLNGDFFGPNAKACGGNYNAHINLEKYIGIFSGKR